jgi:YHS domain-containing protein
MRGLLFLAIVALVVVTLWPLLRGRLGSRPPREVVRRDELVKDPVCQIYVVRSRAVRREIDGVPTYFCSAECAQRYPRGERRSA